MKHNLPAILILLLMIGTFKFSAATSYIIETSDFQFTQSFDSILVGDTVKWVWVSGDHTTTSNGVPFSATPWNVLIDKYHTSFTYVVSVAGTYDYISVPDAPLMGDEFVASWPTGISIPSSAVTNFSVYGNPVHNNIQFHFMLLHPENVDVSLYNLLGVKSQSLLHGYISATDFSDQVSLLPASAPGIYFIILKTDDAMLTKRIVIE